MAGLRHCHASAFHPEHNKRVFRALPMLLPVHTPLFFVVSLPLVPQYPFHYGYRLAGNHHPVPFQHYAQLAAPRGYL